MIEPFTFEATGMVGLRDGQRIKLVETGQIMVMVHHAHVARYFSDMLEQARADFAAMGLAYTFGIEHGYANVAKLREEVHDREMAFNDWTMITIFDHAFFAFSDYNDLCLAKLML